MRVTLRHKSGMNSPMHFVIEVLKAGITLESDSFPFVGTSDQAHAECQRMAREHKRTAKLLFRGRAEWVANPNVIARYTA
jgi:hypothetical protein